VTDAPDTVETTLRMDTGDAAAGADMPGGPGGARGTGDGAGTGVGLGAGGAIAGGLDLASLRVPAPPRASRARPPRLLYPTREAATDESILFVARLTIDSDGFVVGARIVHGHGMNLDEDAESRVWRFRYSPALDDDGRPVRATIEQSFMVE
jgi:outer membrane biosynthesis protein TonB